MKKILVTWAGWYVWSVLVPKLLKKWFYVIAIDKFFFGENKINKHKNLKIVNEDVRNIDEKYFNDNIFWVIDLVAISNDPSWELLEKETYEINFESRYKTAKLAKEFNIEKYIFPSSCSIYWFNDDIVNEDSEANPLTIYSKANLLAEKNILKISDENFRVIVLRQSTLFWPSNRMRFDLAINNMVYNAFSKWKIELMRDWKQKRPFLHVDDTTDFMIFLLENDYEHSNIYNIGVANITLIDLANNIKNIIKRDFNKDIKIEWYWNIDRRSYEVDFDKINNTFNFKFNRRIEFWILEIYNRLLNLELEKTEDTITLEVYKKLKSKGVNI